MLAYTADLLLCDFTLSADTSFPVFALRRSLETEYDRMLQCARVRGGAFYSSVRFTDIPYH